MSVLRFGQAAFELSDQGNGPPSLLRSALAPAASIMERISVSMEGTAPSVSTRGQTVTVVIETASVLFIVVVVTIGPELPVEEFLLTGKIRTSQSDI